jgi:hypothetical protein
MHGTSVFRVGVFYGMFDRGFFFHGNGFITLTTKPVTRGQGGKDKRNEKYCFFHHFLPVK